MSDEVFAEHLNAIDENYRQMPLGIHVPTYDSAVKDAPTRPGNGRPEQYSKAASEKALKICKDAVQAGKQLDYAAVLADVKAGKIA